MTPKGRVSRGRVEVAAETELAMLEAKAERDVLGLDTAAATGGAATGDATAAALALDDETASLQTDFNDAHTYSLEWRSLTYSVKPRKRGSQRLMILDDVSGRCNSGSVLAVRALHASSTVYSCRCIQTFVKGLFKSCRFHKKCAA